MSSGGGGAPVDLKLEVVVLPVGDVDRARDFYVGLGWRLDADVATGDDFRVVQVTPPASPTSVIFGVGVTAAEPGSVDGLVVAVADVAEARADLVARGADVSEVFHDAGGVFRHAGTTARVPGPDPQGRSYCSWAAFSDPDGNTWMLQEITHRLPGREWESSDPAAGVASLAALLKETADRHGPFEASHTEHNWWDWYAAYMDGRRHGAAPDDAAAAAGRYLADTFGVRPR